MSGRTFSLAPRLALVLIGVGLASSASAQSLEQAALEQATRRALERLEPVTVEVEVLGGLPEEVKTPANEQDARRQGGVLTRGGFKQAYGPSTGLIVRQDGLIATSTFILRRKPRHIFVTLSDGRAYVARLLGRDETRGLALLKIEADDLPVAEPAQPEEIKTGRFSLALGRGLGTARPAVARGIVSATGRIGGRAIQSSALISPVNYGGPLAAIDGKVMGVLVPLNMRGGRASVDIYDSGIGFAVPLTDVLALVPRLLEGGVLTPGYLGIQPAPKNEGGVRVASVVPDSPADQAGMQQGDRILKIDGQPTSRTYDLRKVLSARYAGDTIKLALQRGDEQLEVEATLAKPPKRPPPGPRPQRPGQPGQPQPPQPPQDQ